MEDISTPRREPFGSNPNVGEAGRATQRRILAAATEAFATHGYVRTSVEAITDLAGCSRPTFYQYFSGKEDLHRRLAARFGAGLASLLDHITAITPDREGRDQLHEWLEGLGDIHDRYRPIADNFAAAVRTDDQMATGSATLSAAYRRRLVQVIVDPPSGPLAIEAQATAINALAYGASVCRGQIGDVSAVRLTSALADLLHRSIFGAIAGVNVGAAVRGTTVGVVVDAAPPATLDADRQARGLATRTRLIDAAATAFGTLGYEGVRVDDISSEAGVSHGTFYRYFADKDAIFAEHADAATGEITELLRRWPLAPGEETEWANDYYKLFSRRGGVIACLPEAGAAGLPSASRSRQEVSLALQAALDTRDFGDTDADVVICFALLESLAATAFRELGISIQDAIDATALILHRGVFGAPA